MQRVTVVRTPIDHVYEKVAAETAQQNITIESIYRKGMGIVLRDVVGGNGNLEHLSTDVRLPGVPVPLKTMFKRTETEDGKGSTVRVLDTPYMLAAIRALVSEGHINPKLQPDIDRLIENERNTERSMIDFWIRQGWFKVGDGKIQLIRARWYLHDETGKRNNTEVQLAAVRFLVEKVLKVDPTNKKELGKLTKKDFEENMLATLIHHVFKGVYNAINSAYPEVAIKEWEMATVPLRYYGSTINRAKITNAILTQSGKLDEPWTATRSDFERAGVIGMIDHNFSGRIFLAIKEAGLVPKDKEAEWEAAMSARNPFANLSRG